jgi:hypothetical protein
MLGSNDPQLYVFYVLLRLPHLNFEAGTPIAEISSAASSRRVYFPLAGYFFRGHMEVLLGIGLTVPR